jgi:nucleoside transporter
MDATKPAGGSTVTLRLSIMMFLQFFLWGAWYVTLGPFMKAHGMSDGAVGNAYTVGPIAAILAPVFLGMIADRFFASQVVLGLLHILGGVCLLAAPSLVSKGETAFVGILLGHMLCYMPTLGLSNTVAFHSITNPEKQFPLIRVLGTIGWIVAGFVVGYFAKSTAGAGASESAIQGQPVFFYVAGASGVLLGLFSFALPHTPPPQKGKPFNAGAALGLDSIRLLKDPAFAIFMVASFLICIPLAAYYSFAGIYAGATGLENVPVKMSFGQMSEIFFMLVMPLVFVRLGVKWMLAVGMLAWVVRYGFFASAWGGAGGHHVIPMVLGGIILHGICYDFFFVTGQIYTEQRAPKEVRAQAQGFLVLATQGFGLGLGAQLFPRLVAHYTTKGADGKDIVDWQQVWIWPSAFALVVLVLFVLLFRPAKGPAKTA